MGKGGDLWDDSALVTAFDRAVSSFKVMHGKNTQATSCENEKPDPPASAEQEEPFSADATDDWYSPEYVNTYLTRAELSERL